MDGRAWLQRIELRRAVSLAVDRHAIVNTVYLGAAEPVWTSVTSSHGDWYVADLPRPSRDVAQAKTLLESIGLSDRNGDGLVEDAAASRRDFRSSRRRGTRSASARSPCFRRSCDIGLTVDTIAVDPGALFKSYSERSYDAMYFVAPSDSTDPARNLDFWMSSGSYHYWNPDQKTPATPWEGPLTS